MPAGSGKYDELCTYVREKSGGIASAIVVLHGQAGAGFSVQCPKEHSLMLANIFRHVANEIEREITDKNPPPDSPPEAL